MKVAISEIIDIVFVSCIFVLAMLYCKDGLDKLRHEQEVIQAEIQGNEVIYASSAWEHAEDVISSDELYSRMIHPIDYDVKLNDTLFLSSAINAPAAVDPLNPVIATVHNFNTFNYALIEDGAFYKVSYEYDATGAITTVCYDKR